MANLCISKLNLFKYTKNVSALNRLTNQNRSTIPLSYTCNHFHTSAVSESLEVSQTKNKGEYYGGLDPHFENAEEAYKSKSTWEIVRAMVVFKLCSNETLVNKNMELMKLAKRILGRNLFKRLMKATFYGHFVAGEDEEDIKPTIHRMRQFGVKSILDYSVEEDVPSQEPPVPTKQPDYQNLDATRKKFKVHQQFDRRKNVVSARTYFYQNEASCEKNMAIFLKSIDAVSGATNSTGFAAIKLTALGRPKLLMQLSEVFVQSHLFFQDLVGTKDDPIKTGINRKDFESQLIKMGISTDKQEVRQWFNEVDFDKDGIVDLFEWRRVLDQTIQTSNLFKIPNLETGKLEPIIPALSTEEEKMLRNMMRRLKIIAEHAREKDVRVMIDAEQSYFQPAISRLTMELMRIHNKEKAYIFNTYQCYLKEAYNNITVDLDLSRREDFYFGCKLVRGAYMEQERERARALGYEDPILPDFDHTNQMYHRVLLESMRQIKERGGQKVAIMVASHNEDTVRFTVQKMKEFSITPQDRVICFGQLLGMCDQVSFPLGQAGYSVYKYVPYGPVNEVLPYLSRRAQENRGLLLKVKKERRLLWTELMRRLKSGQLFYKPDSSLAPQV